MTEAPRPPADGDPGGTPPEPASAPPSPAPPTPGEAASGGHGSFGTPPPPAAPRYAPPGTPPPPGTGYPPHGGTPPPPGAPPPPGTGYPPYGGYPPPEGGHGGYPPPAGTPFPGGSGYYGGRGVPVGFTNSDEKTWALLAHFGGVILGFLAPLIVMLAKGNESATVKAHAVEALNFQITWGLATVVASILAVCSFGLLFFLPMITWIVIIVFSILGGVKANEGALYRYPMSIRMVK